MIGALRKFSGSIYAKILLGIIIIPFVFWGMGSTFFSGNKNVVVTIDNEKYSTQEVVNFIQRYSDPNIKLMKKDIADLLSIFIGDKLVEREIEQLNIKLSDSSLSRLLKNQKEFERENKFSRVEYEKFLLKNNITASNFENSLSNHEKKKQLVDFIGGGTSPTKFLVNARYNEMNQKRNVQIINLDLIYKDKKKFSDNEIEDYFKKNKNKYEETYKSAKLLELLPSKITNEEEFSELYFQKLDEIDDMIVQGQDFDFIIKKLNLKEIQTIVLNKFGENKNSEKIHFLNEDLIEKIFNISEDENISLIENEGKYYVIEIVNTEKLQRDKNEEFVRKDIIKKLNNEIKRKSIINIIKKINTNTFPKSDFDKLSSDHNVEIKKIRFKNQNDDKLLKKELVKQIYSFQKNKVILISDIGLSENYLIYIDKIENVIIAENSDEYQKYLDLSKVKIVNRLYNAYDNYLKEKYEIEINYQALDTIKNYFN